MNNKRKVTPVGIVWTFIWTLWAGLTVLIGYVTAMILFT